MTVQFFEARGGAMYPINSIDRMYKSSTDRDGTKRPARIFRVDKDEPVEVYDYTIDAIVSAGGSRFSACPGYRLLTFSYYPGDAEAGPYIFDEPIVGWRVDELCAVQPLVLDGEFQAVNSNQAIQEPNGIVHSTLGRFDTKDAWATEMKAGEDRILARQASA